MLKAAGITPVVVDDGDSALVTLRARPDIDLVLMDVRMPRLNGIEAMKRIRADTTLKALKVIAVTASVFPEFKEKAIQSGFDDFLGKPFRTHELISKLRKHLRVRFVDRLESTEEMLANTQEVSLDPDRAATVAAGIRKALKLGNVTALNSLASDLQSEPGTAEYGKRIHKLASDFDFAGLEGLAEHLESQSQ